MIVPLISQPSLHWIYFWYLQHRRLLRSVLCSVIVVIKAFLPFSSTRVAPAVDIRKISSPCPCRHHSRKFSRHYRLRKIFSIFSLQLPHRHLHYTSSSMADGVFSTMPHPRTERLPRSPTSLSSNSSRRVSLRSSVQSEKQQSPPSPPARLNRKRAASLEIVEANSPAISELSISSPRSDPANSASHVCLCQPDPKIPRPRNGTCNAFIRISDSFLPFRLLWLQMHPVAFTAFISFACLIGAPTANKPSLYSVYPLSSTLSRPSHRQ